MHEPYAKCFCGVSFWDLQHLHVRLICYTGFLARQSSSSVFHESVSLSICQSVHLSVETYCVKFGSMAASNRCAEGQVYLALVSYRACPEGVYVSLLFSTIVSKVVTACIIGELSVWRWLGHHNW